MSFKLLIHTILTVILAPVSVSATIGPIQLSPAYQTYLWGGTRIATEYNREGLPPCVAESWELSDRQEGMSFIKNGPYAGMSIKHLLEQNGKVIIGEDRSTYRLPILIKIIDAKKDLSVQVHPNETMAAILNSEAKAEAWYALSDSFVYAGFKGNVTPDMVKNAIEANTLETLLQRIDLQKGEMIYIPGGSVHAIGQGSFILEIQQNSNTTYRLYDWGRVGSDGKARPLHIEEGLAALDWDNLFIKKQPSILQEQSSEYRIDLLLKTPYFQVRQIVLNGEYSPSKNLDRFVTYFCEEGAGVLFTDASELTFHMGETFIIPPSSEDTYFCGNMKLIEVSLP